MVHESTPNSEWASAVMLVPFFVPINTGLGVP
nr:MAG TPA: hypothetical protein [Caudoviricetes sp.]